MKQDCMGAVSTRLCAVFPRCAYRSGWGLVFASGACAGVGPGTCRAARVRGVSRDRIECNKHSGDIGMRYIGVVATGLRLSDAAAECVCVGGGGAWGVGRDCRRRRGRVLLT